MKVQTSMYVHNVNGMQCAIQLEEVPMEGSSSAPAAEKEESNELLDEYRKQEAEKKFWPNKEERERLLG